MPTTLDLVMLRTKLFSNKLSQLQIDGMSGLLTGFDAALVTDNRFKAYMLATVFHECAGTMQPVEEWGKGANKPYGPIYYGRGFVQLTWEYNYTRLGPHVGADLVAKPDLALNTKYATLVLVLGMTQGLFTGRKLNDYFTAGTGNPINARRIINGTDEAVEIAHYYEIFQNALGMV